MGSEDHEMFDKSLNDPAVMRFLLHRLVECIKRDDVPDFMIATESFLRQLLLHVSKHAFNTFFELSKKCGECGATIHLKEIMELNEINDLGDAIFVIEYGNFIVCKKCIQEIAESGHTVAWKKRAW